ncbi:MAG: cytochrome b/b6 domain-containing protein [Alphaproteobacteria bacterium]|nr:cytochrome b/b6 domain-containing protein [Alphaproteobacteria bacterium]
MRKVVIWDAPTRLFHWLTAILVAAAYATWRFDQMDWHIWVGYALLALVIFRLLWGLFGSETARFAAFLAPPRAAFVHLAHLFRREPDREIGHNPAGGWMVLVLLALLLGEALSGLYVNNDVADPGPLTQIVPARISNLIDALHTYLWWTLLAAVTLHVLAVALYRMAKGQNLVLPMVTGRKTLPPEMRAPALAGPLRMLLVLGGSLIAVAVLINFL